MPNSDKDIVITPNRGSSTADPSIRFTGGNATVANSVNVSMYADGTLSFDGTAGQLFSITNSLTGTIFSVNDVSGIPSIEVTDSGIIRLAQYNGNVGVGTGTPTSTFHVQGNSLTTGTTQSGSFIPTGATVPTNGLYYPATNRISLATNSTERVTVDSTGNVGIGTSNPLNALDVTGDIRSTSVIKTDYIGNKSYVAGQGYLRFTTSDTIFTFNTTEQLRLTSTGNIGIGTSTVASRLEVWGGNVDIAQTGFGLIFPDNSFQTTAFNSTAAVTSFSAGTTGLTPSTGTTGAVTLGGTLNAANGGTGQSTYAIGDILYASASTTLSKLAGVATGNALISGGVTTAPSWGKIGLTTHVSGTLPVANGGTGLTSYTTGDIVYASASGTLASLVDVATGNVVISGGVGVAPSYGKVGLTTHVTGTLPVANGGTGLTSGISGGVLYYSAAGTLASSGALAASALVVGGGAGAAPSTITTGTGVTTALGVNTGTAGAFVVNGGALGTPSSGNLISCTALPLSTGVTGTLAVANGGTGLSSYTQGDLIYATGATTIGRLADVATGNVLISGGVSADPSWGKVGLTTHVTGTLPVANGGTGLTSGTSGGVLYYSAAGTLASSAALAASSLVVGGGAGVAPSTITTGTGVTTALGVNTGTAGAFVVNGGALGTPSSGNLISCTSLPLSTGVTGTLGLSNGGTNASLTASNGGVIYSTASAFAVLAGTATAGQHLQSGASGAPSWTTATFPGTATGTGTILRADGTNWVATTATYPATTTANQLLYSSAANTIGGLTSANTAALVTNNSGVPAFTAGTTANRVLRTDGTTVSFAQVALGTDVSGTLPIANGGTNATATPTAGAVSYGTGTAYAFTTAGISGNILISGGAGAPTWGQSYTSSNVPNSVVSRDASGNFSAGTITAGTGLTVSAGGITVTGFSQITGNLNISGNLVVSGNINTLNSNVLVVSDPIIYVGDNNPANIWDLGIVSSYTTDRYRHTGFARNQTDGVWTIFDNLITEPTQTINWSQSGLNFGSFKVGNINVAASTVSTSTTTGAIIIAGGVGVGGNINVGGTNNALGTITSGTWNGAAIGLTYGGTNASLTASNGGVIYSTASAFAVLAGTATAGQHLQSGASGAPSWTTATFPGTATVTGTILRADGTNWVATTATYPATTTANQLLYSSAANTIGGLTSANTAALVTNNSGVPAFTAGTTANRVLRTDGTTVSFAQVALGTDVSGTLPVGNGGTGLTSYTTGDIVYASAAGTLASLVDVATGNVVISGGVGVAPSYGKVGLTTHVTGTLPVANGGTGLTAGTSGGILYYSATGTLASSAALAASALVVGGGAGVAPSTITTGTGVVTALGVNTGTAGAFVVNGGALGTPSSGNLISCTALPLTTGVTGTLPVGNGGTGATTFTTNGLLYGNGTSAVQVTAQGGANTILTANAGAPSFSATPTIGTSVTVPLVVGGSAASSSLTLQSTSGAGTSDSITFKVGNAGATTAMTVNTSGNVGIGTSTVNYKLQVNDGVVGVTGTPVLVSGATNYIGSPINLLYPSMYVNTNISAGAASTSAGGLFSQPSFNTNGYNGSAISASWNIPILKSSTGSDTAFIYGAVNQSMRNSNSDVSTGSISTYGTLNFAGHWNASNTAISYFSNQSYATSSSTYNYNGTITNMYGASQGIYIGALANTTGSTTNAYGLHTTSQVGASSGTGTGTLTNYYDAYLNGVTVAATGTVTNKYGLYQVKTDHINYFGGNVGIGTASPITPLHVQGSATITGDATIQGTLFETSDIALKDNVETITGAIDIVNQLRGVNFDWKASGNKSSGIIAQELEQVLPYLVREDETGYKTVNYTAIIGVLIEAIKELSDKVGKQ